MLCYIMLHTSVVLRWKHFRLSCTLLLPFGDQTSCNVVHFCCTSVTKLHVTLRIIVAHFHDMLHMSVSSVVLLWPTSMLRCTLLLYFGEQTSCYVSHFCCASVNTLPVTLHTSVVLRWTHFLLRCTLLLYFGEQTSCYVVHFCCTSVTNLHFTLYTSVVLLWPNFMLRCALLLDFGEHTSCYVAHFFGEHAWCYVAHFCCTSVNTLHVTLHTSVVLRWPNFMLRCTLALYFGDQRLCAVSSEAAQRCLPILVQ